MDETKLRAVLEYGDRLKTRSENDILFDKIKSHINTIVICIVILYYFRYIIVEMKSTKPNYSRCNNSINRNQFIPLLD
jgi:hypothetical protein